MTGTPPGIHQHYTRKIITLKFQLQNHAFAHFVLDWGPNKGPSLHHNMTANSHLAYFTGLDIRRITVLFTRRSFLVKQIAGWEALNDRQTGLLMDQRREIELAEAGNYTNLTSCLPLSFADNHLNELRWKTLAFLYPEIILITSALFHHYLGILNNAQTLLGEDTIDSLSGLVNPQTLAVFREQDRWKKLSRGSASHTAAASAAPLSNDLFKNSTSWIGIRSQLDAEGKLLESPFQIRMNNYRLGGICIHANLLYFL
jgi:hypothetical protein